MEKRCERCGAKPAGKFGLLDILTMRSTVTTVRTRTTRNYVEGSGIGDKSQFTEVPCGWFVTLDHLYVIGVGKDKPELEVGDGVELTLRKVL